MKNFTVRTLGYGAIASLALGVSGCYMDGNDPRTVDYSMRNTNNQTVKAEAQKTAAQKTVETQTVKHSSSSDPVQRTAPGPKRAAAPQLPVIQ